jgi:hypothetical protein
MMMSCWGIYFEQCCALAAFFLMGGQCSEIGFDRFLMGGGIVDVLQPI